MDGESFVAPESLSGVVLQRVEPGWLLYSFDHASLMFSGNLVDTNKTLAVFLQGEFSFQAPFVEDRSWSVMKICKVRLEVDYLKAETIDRQTIGSVAIRSGGARLTTQGERNYERRSLSLVEPIDGARGDDVTLYFHNWRLVRDGNGEKPIVVFERKFDPNGPKAESRVSV